MSASHWRECIHSCEARGSPDVFSSESFAYIVEFAGILQREIGGPAGVGLNQLNFYLGHVLAFMDELCLVSSSHVILLWDSPYCMHWMAIVVLLEHEHTRSFGEVGVVLDQLGIPDSRDQVTHKYPICRQFVIAVLRNSDLALHYQGDNLSERLTHWHRLHGNCGHGKMMVK
jgi:hypothetical protein